MEELELKNKILGITTKLQLSGFTVYCGKV